MQRFTVIVLQTKLFSRRHIGKSFTVIAHFEICDGPAIMRMRLILIKFKRTIKRFHSIFISVKHTVYNTKIIV